jgi:hypothetical protein
MLLQAAESHCGCTFRRWLHVLAADRFNYGSGGVKAIVYRGELHRAAIGVVTRLEATGSALRRGRATSPQA